MPANRRAAPRRGFTLVELLVVILIIGLISAAALPLVLPALNERRVSEAARILQAILAGTRDAAIRANAPRGIRLLPDPVFNGLNGNALASNRIIPIEPAPEYSEGVVTLSVDTSLPNNIQRLKATEVVFLSQNPTIYSNPTSWYWNIRQGDKIRFNDSGSYYTVAGPMITGPGGGNSERFITNYSQNDPKQNLPIGQRPAEVIYLVNGLDDDQDGFIDDAFDGLDNDGDQIVDPLFNGLDDDGDGTIDNETTALEYEAETFDGALAQANNPFLTQTFTYTIYRRPVVSQGARETTLPAGIVIDLTGFNAPTVPLTQGYSGPLNLLPERSRLPVDPYTGYVDILISPSGQVLLGGPGTAGGSVNTLAPTGNQPFYHFWLTEREGVVAPLWGTTTSVAVTSTKNASMSDIASSIPKPNPNGGTAATSQNYLLPMPQGTANYSTTTNTYLTGERRLVTLFVKTGQIVSNSIPDQVFNGSDTNAPYYNAQAGVKEPL